SVTALRAIRVSSRVDDLFLVLKVIRRSVDKARGLTTTSLAAADADRRGADDCRDADDVAALHALCGRAIDERESLGTSLEAIRSAIAAADIVPRTRNLGVGARGTTRFGERGSSRRSSRRGSSE